MHKAFSANGLHVLCATPLAAMAFAAVSAKAEAAPPEQDTERAARTRPDEARGWDRPPGVEGEDVVLFVPRVVLSVPRYVLMGIFYPAEKGIRAVEKHEVVEHVRDVLYNDARTAGVLPVVAYQSGFGVSAGAKAFHRNLLGHREALELKARYGGEFVQAYQLHFKSRRVGGGPAFVDARVRYEINPRLRFSGIGDPPEPAAGPLVMLDPRSASVSTRYRQERLLGLLEGGLNLGSRGALVQTGAAAIFNHRNFASLIDPVGGDVSTDAVYDTSRITSFDAGADVLELDGTLRVDTRDHAGQPSKGVFLEMFAGRPLPIDDFDYWHYGTELNLFINLYRHTRVLMLQAAVEATLGDYEAISFSELPRLGGPHRLRGYPLDRFRDRVASMGTVQYTYPIHASVQGELFIDVGRVGANHRSVLDPGNWSDWRVGGGGGFIFSTKDDVLLRLDVSYGEGLQFFVTTDPVRAFKGRSKVL